MALVASNIITYQGRIRTLYDALLILEATRLDMLPTINRRLTPPERSQYIKPNTVFVWNETKCGMRRWTDGKLWLALKVYHGQFLIYKQLTKDKEIDPNGLVKQLFLVVNKQNHRLHLICYYKNDEMATTRRRKRRRVADSYLLPEALDDDYDDPAFRGVAVPLEDEKFDKLEILNKIYPDNLVDELPRRRNMRKRQVQQLPTPPSLVNTSPGVSEMPPSVNPVSRHPLPMPAVPLAQPMPMHLLVPLQTLPVPLAPGYRSQYTMMETRTLLVLDRAFA